MVTNRSRYLKEIETNPKYVKRKFHMLRGFGFRLFHLLSSGSLLNGNPVLIAVTLKDG